MLRIGTYNLHCGGSPEHWDALLRDLRLDIILAQESNLPPRIYGPAGSVLWSPVEGQEWGSAIVARYPTAHELCVTSFAGWVAGAVLEVGDGSVAVFSIHNPTIKGKSYITLLNQILDEIRALDLGLPTIIGGDFNLVSAGLRQAREELQTTKAESSIIQRLASEFGLVGCWQCVHPDEPLPQTLRWTRNPAAPYHCDGIFIPKAWASDLASCSVAQGDRWDRFSDHNPVVATVGTNSVRGLEVSR